MASIFLPSTVIVTRLRRRREVPVPETVVDRLEVPLDLSGVGVEAHDRLRKQVGARPLAAVIVAARRRGRQVEQPARLVERHRRPHVAWPLPRHDSFSHVSAPGSFGRLLRDHREHPFALAGARVDRLHLADRIRQLHAVREPGCRGNHEVLVDDWRRALREVGDVGDARQVGQRHPSVFAERRNRLAGLGVEREQPMTAAQENADVVAVAPERRAAQLPAARRQQLSELVGFAVEPPQLLAVLSVNRRDAVVRRRDVEHTVEHQRRAFEKPRRGLVLLRRGVSQCFHCHANSRFLDILGRDVGQRRIFHAALIAAVIRPLRLTRGLCERDRQRQGNQRRDACPHPGHINAFANFFRYCSLRDLR